MKQGKINQQPARPCAAPLPNWYCQNGNNTQHFVVNKSIAWNHRKFCFVIFCLFYFSFEVECWLWWNCWIVFIYIFLCIYIYLDKYSVCMCVCFAAMRMLILFVQKAYNTQNMTFKVTNGISTCLWKCFCCCWIYVIIVSRLYIFKALKLLFPNIIVHIHTHIHFQMQWTNSCANSRQNASE